MADSITSIIIIISVSRHIERIIYNNIADFNEVDASRWWHQAKITVANVVSAPEGDDVADKRLAEGSDAEVAIFMIKSHPSSTSFGVGGHKNTNTKNIYLEHWNVSVRALWWLRRVTRHFLLRLKQYRKYSFRRLPDPILWSKVTARKGCFACYRRERMIIKEGLHPIRVSYWVRYLRWPRCIFRLKNCCNTTVRQNWSDGAKGDRWTFFKKQKTHRITVFVPGSLSQWILSIE